MFFLTALLSTLVLHIYLYLACESMSRNGYNCAYKTETHTSGGSFQGKESPDCSFDTFNDLTITRLEYNLITSLLCGQLGAWHLWVLQMAILLFLCVVQFCRVLLGMPVLHERRMVHREVLAVYFPYFKDYLNNNNREVLDSKQIWKGKDILYPSPLWECICASSHFRLVCNWAKINIDMGRWQIDR